MMILSKKIMSGDPFRRHYALTKTPSFTSFILPTSAGVTSKLKSLQSHVPVSRLSFRCSKKARRGECFISSPVQVVRSSSFEEISLPAEPPNGPPGGTPGGHTGTPFKVQRGTERSKANSKPFLQENDARSSNEKNDPKHGIKIHVSYTSSKVINGGELEATTLATREASPPSTREASPPATREYSPPDTREYSPPATRETSRTSSGENFLVATREQSPPVIKNHHKKLTRTSSSYYTNYFTFPSPTVTSDHTSAFKKSTRIEPTDHPFKVINGKGDYTSDLGGNYNFSRGPSYRVKNFKVLTTDHLPQNLPSEYLLHLLNSSGSSPRHRWIPSVRWVLSHGEDLLDFHQVPQNTLLGITRQVDSFNHFYSTAKREADKGASLLLQEEESILPSEDFEEAQDLAKNLRRHLSSFANRLHLTKDRLEDTAKCYLLLDKAYEWALEAMKAVGRVKTSGTATPDQVGAAVEAIGGLLQENPPVPEDTFNAMLDMASKLNNQTLLQQCKMAHARCEETMSLLRSRQASLLKARRQMEFDCQSFVDLNDVIEEPPPLTWLAGNPLNSSGRRRSGCSVGSRPRDPLSRCSSFDTDDDSVFSEAPLNSTPTKLPVEAKSSLGGIKELSESNEDVRGNRNFVRSPRSYMRSSAIDFRLAVSTVDPPIVLGRTSPPMALLTAPLSAVRAFSSGSSSCSSSDSSGPVTGNNLFKDHSRSSWRFSDTSHRSAEEANDSLDESIHPLSPLSNRCSLPSAANSHLLIRGSQINLSNSEDLSNEEVRRNKTLLLIMQELIQTERDYVNSLEYIIENYGPELLRDDIPQALRGQRNVIFGNIEKIFEFHSGYFLRSLENCQSRPFAVGSIFLKYETQFYLYALYNKNKPKSDDLMSELGSSFFKGKQMELGDKMDLSSYLLKPVQRMGKYALLLKQLLKECDRNEEGFEDLKAAEEMVQFQLRHGNDLLAMDSLRDCDVNLKEQGRLLRQGEFLVSEGNKGKKALRHVFLFEDLILFSKTKRDPEKKTLDVFQYKQSLKTSDIGLTEQVGENPLKFEIWFRKRKPSDTFVLQASSLSMKEAWTEEISKLLWRQALKNRKLRLHEMSSMGIGNKPCLDIRPSEDQINDRSVCMGKAPPRLRLSSSNGLSDNSSGVRRPHSVISVSSSGSSTGSSHSSSAGPSFVGTLNLGFESGDSPKPLQRSVTRTSQCSAESGILADLFPDRDVEDNHTKVERSNSTATNTSVDSALSPSSPMSPTSYPSSPSTLSLSEGGSTHPLTRLLPVEGSSTKTVLTTEV